jgi:hypothetical protein
MDELNNQEIMAVAPVLWCSPGSWPSSSVSKSAGHNGPWCYGAFDCVVSFHLQRGAASRARRSALNRSRLSWKAFCARL